MDISYSLAMEDHARINPLQGLEALAEKIVPSGAKMQTAPTRTDVKDRNAASLEALKGMLKKTSNNPLAKTRRAK